MIIIKIIVVIILIYLLYKYGNMKHSTKLEKCFIALMFLLFLQDTGINMKGIISCGLAIIYVVYKRFRNVAYTIDAYNDINYLNRDINTKLNPSIISYLVNSNINLYNLSADIMNLYANKIIDIDDKSKEDPWYQLKLGENYNEETLHESQKYIIERLIIDKGKLFNKFEFKKWKEMVIREYRNSGLIRENVAAYLFIAMIIILVILAIVLLVVTFKIGQPFIAIIFIGLEICFYKALQPILTHLFLKINDTTLNEDGKEEFKKWVKFKKFMQEYTLIKDKNIEDIAIYEKYIPYSVTLGIVEDYDDILNKILTESQLKEIKEEIVE